MDDEDLRSGYKRRNPYSQQTDAFSVKRAGVGGAAHAGREYVEPRVFEQPNLQYDNYGEQRRHNGTDFNKWSPDQIKAFLDQRGGDYDDCSTLDQLVERAVEVEINTGPAAPPAPAPAAAEEEYDPLEAFMSDINTEVQATKATEATKPASSKPAKPDLACDDEYDPLEYALSRKAAAAQATAAATAAASAAVGYESDEEVYAAARAADAAGTGLQYDAEDNPIMDRRKVDELPPLDHSLIEYEPFAKDFYEEGPEMFAMDDAEVAVYRKQLEVRVAGFDAPKPVKEFNQCGFDNALLAAIKKAGYERPTPIQAQALPAVLSGRDVLGIAKTGSGKTAAFVLPMLVHVMDQPELAAGTGPIAVIVAPTRELAEQIHKETRKFAKVYSLRVAAAIGGMNKYDQSKDLKAGAEVAVATPGRLIDHIKGKACNMQRATYLVLDEADRMFDLGFEPQVRSIVGQIRPDRQTLLFSATMPRKIQRLAAEALTNPITITVGATGVANADVHQEVQVLADDPTKMKWLIACLPDYVDQGEVIIFVGQRAKVEQLVAELTKLGMKAGGIHGDLDQYSRMEVLNKFRSGALHVLVATDVAARGLDIKTIKTVVNYDTARDIDTHIHRVGRTGRAGDKEGLAVTLLLPNDSRFAAQLVQSLAAAGQPISAALHDLALKDQHFKKGSARNKGGKGRKGGQVGGAGLGFGVRDGEGGGAGHREGGVGTNSNTGVGAYSTLASAGNASARGFQELPGFAKSHDRYEVEAGAAAALTATEAAQVAKDAEARGALPPPPPLPVGGLPEAAALSNLNSAQGQLGAVPSAQLPGPPPVAGGVVSGGRRKWGPDPSAVQAQQPAQAVQAVQPAQAVPPVQVPPALQGHQTTAAARQSMDDERDEGRQFVRQFHENRFRSSFVSSGTAGGTVHTGATIVAPKKQNPARPLPPPPVPVTERPMYLTQPQGGFGGGMRRSFTDPRSVFGNSIQSAGVNSSRDLTSNSSYHNAPPPSVYGGGGGAASGVDAAAAAAKAIAAAQAIAARLAAQAPPGGG